MSMSVCFPSYLVDDNSQLPFPDVWSPLKFVSNLLITLPRVPLVFLQYCPSYLWPCLFKLEMQFTYHKIHPFNCVSQWFFLHSQGCITVHHYLILEHFHCLQKKPCLHFLWPSSSLAAAHSSQLPRRTGLLALPASRPASPLLMPPREAIVCSSWGS